MLAKSSAPSRPENGATPHTPRYSATQKLN
jgi:hypothetical protein